MALTISQLKRGAIDGSAFRVYDITHDGSVTSISAGSMDMDYIEAIVGHHCYASMAAPASQLMNLLHVSINASNSGVVWAATEANAKSILTVLGW